MTVHNELPWYASRVAAFFGALFLVYGVALPFLPVLLDARGLDAGEIGLIASVPLVLRLIVTPLIAVEADRRNDHRGAIVALAAIGLAAVALIAVARGFWPILLAVVAFQVAIQSTMPLIETVAMAGVRRAGHDYGRMRLAGSATFILAIFAGAAAIARAGPEIVVALLFGGTAATLASALLLPPPDSEKGAQAGPGLSLSALSSLLLHPPFLLFLVATGAVQSSHAVFYTFGVLHWRTTAIPSTWIGALWAVGVVAEIVLFWFSAIVLQRFGAVRLLVVGAAAALLRWIAMAYDPGLSALFALQALHGATYGASHLGAMHFIKAYVPEELSGTAQALYSIATAGIGMGLAMILAGYAYKQYGGSSYFAMAGLAMLSLVAAMGVARSYRDAGTPP